MKSSANKETRRAVGARGSFPHIGSTPKSLGLKVPSSILGLLVSLLALIGCNGPPKEGTLVITFDAYEETYVAAQWWNANDPEADWSVEQGTCSREPCIVVLLGDCAETEPVAPGQYKACMPDSENPRIEIQPALLEAYERGELDLSQTLAHEIGHVMGHEHSSRPWNIMSTPGEFMSWAVPY